MVLLISGLGLLTLFGQAAIAGSVTCPESPTSSQRVFTLTLTDPANGTCLGYDAGNLNGNDDAINQLGYVTLDKSDDLDSGAASGSLTVNPPTSGLNGSFSFTPVTGYTDYVIAFKSGQGQADPEALVQSGCLITC